MDWKETVTLMSDKVFPGINYKVENIENEVMSNLPLQMSLYFNSLFTPFWSAIMLKYIYDTFDCLDELYKYLTIALLAMIFVLELLRLYLGYEGNLKDKITELAGFWMISVLVQIPLQAFLLLNPYFHMKVFEKFNQAVMFSFLIVQLIAGYFALKNTASKQATYYKIMKLRNNDYKSLRDLYKNK